ncbi:MAG TPA: MJ0042-type zinc finger domain-containing protein, partial [Steroidobacteraceae bacterium]|nr:MJ0042-type zinc finger domain-containing protein [Steroidobacteraceae bacterium]
MFTVCPKCALTLVVTAADLRVAQGYVRCGRCSSVFNALAQLSDERTAARAAEAPPPEPEPQEPAEPQAAEPPAAPLALREEEGTSEDALEFNPETTDAASVFVAAQPDPGWTAATGSFKSLVAANQEPVTPVPGPGAAGEDVDVELDAALLSDIVRSEPLAPRPTGAAPARREPAAPTERARPIPAAPSPATAA